MIRRVVVTGSESTGKTTLAAALAAHYETVWSPEHVRDYVAARNAPVRAEDVEAIARELGACPAWIEEEVTRRRADL